MNKFYTKLLKVYNIKLLSDSFIFSSISWLINAKYRKYSKLNSFLKNQPINDEILKLAQKLKNKNPDITVINILKYIKKHIKYKNDKYEEWKNAIQTLLDMFGDCDDMNSLVYILCRLAGVHQFQLFCGIGSMSNGGHFFPLYYSTKERKLVTLDTTYYASVISVKNRDDFNDLSYHKNLWYLFNEDICVKPIN